jgi:hypothetical protein
MRSRFQFRLRTLLIGVTFLAVACAYVAHEAKIVTERKAMVDRILHFEDGYITRDGPWGPIDHNKSLPWIRRLLGDESIVAVDLPAGCTLTALEINEVLPEAAVHNYVIDPKTRRRTILPNVN